jgi:hypothetical protein
VDFSFPNFVRAIDTIIALAPREGRAAFADRCEPHAKFTAECAYKFAGDKIKEMLKTAYALRSDSTHGKPFGYCLGSESEKFMATELYQCVFLLESVARKVIRWAIFDPKFVEITNSRSSLESYWKQINSPAQS